MSDMSASMHRELFDTVCGTLLGQGSARQVFAHRQDASLVVKVESYSRSFQNIVEWEVWRECAYTRHSKWFAPCVDISPNGSVMLMRRTEPIQLSQLPKRLPEFLKDMKQDNFGIYEGRVVCHDYGIVRPVTRDSLRARAIHWQ